MRDCDKGEKTNSGQNRNLMHSLLQKRDRVTASNWVSWRERECLLEKYGRSHGARLLLLISMSVMESCRACGTPFTKATKEEGSAEARYSRDWPVDAKMEV